MTVTSFTKLIIHPEEQLVALYGLDSRDTIYEGLACDIPEEYTSLQVIGMHTLILPTTTICINVCSAKRKRYWEDIFNGDI